jgi:hypothetical protein
VRNGAATSPTIDTVVIVVRGGLEDGFARLGFALADAPPGAEPAIRATVDETRSESRGDSGFHDWLVTVEIEIGDARWSARFRVRATELEAHGGGLFLEPGADREIEAAIRDARVFPGAEPGDGRR